MTETPSYDVREYRPGDEHAILEAFNRIFARIDPTFRPRDLETWRWLYERNPSGRRIYLCATEQGRVLAQYAGLPQRMRIDGQPGYFSQSVDSMSDPEFRRLSKTSLFVLAGRAYDEHYGGQPPDKDTLMWGLPVPAAFRIGKKELKYELVRQLCKHVAPLASVIEEAGPSIDVETRTDFPDDVVDLFELCARERGAIAVRDQAQLTWRFTSHPAHRYEIGLARRGRQLTGLAVFRRGSFDLEEDGLVCDWLVPASDAATTAALRRWLVERARAADCNRLVALFPDTSPEWLDWQRAGFRIQKTRYFLVAWSFSKRHDLRWMWRHWYYTLGDTDLC